MVDVVFVHGTGVREPAFGQLLEKVRAGLHRAELQHPWQLHGCYWGDTCGSRLQQGSSIPAYAQAKAMDGAAGPGADDELAAWSLLYDDPLIELRLHAAKADAAGGQELGKPPHLQLLPSLQALRLELATVSGLAGSSLDALTAALTTVAEFGQLKSAIDSCTRDYSLNQAREVIARAICAGWISRLVTLGGATPDADGRDQLVAKLFTALGGDANQQKKVAAALRWALLAPLRLLARPPAYAAMHMATAASRFFRNSMFDLVSPAVGDILLYQARGQTIRDAIAASVAAVGRPVVLIAHSLGGIACIEWLLQEHRPLVKGVVTAGSQAPYFHEIGALATLQRDDPLPEHMPPWLNFYDRNDLLSFIAYPALKRAGQSAADDRVVDVEVRSGQPFPAAHSAYWSSKRVWQRTAEFLERLEA